MIRRPPSSTRTDTLFPYTTLFRSVVVAFDDAIADPIAKVARPAVGAPLVIQPARIERPAVLFGEEGGFEFLFAPLRPLVEEGVGDRSRHLFGDKFGRALTQRGVQHRFVPVLHLRSEERRVGKACVRTCRSRCSPYH